MSMMNKIINSKGNYPQYTTKCCFSQDSITDYGVLCQEGVQKCYERAVKRISRSDKPKNNKSNTTVLSGASQNGNSRPKLSKIISPPSMPIEYIAPFLRYAYLAITSMPRMVNSRTTNAPMPLPIKISGTESVNANAPITPSMENDASSTSRYKILLHAPKFFECMSSSSLLSALCLKPSVKKNAVVPIAAASAIRGFVLTQK